MRLDKYLKNARLIKRRTVANEACDTDRVEVNGKVIHKSASIGVAMFPDHGSTYERLVECADKALYAVKGSGRDAFIMYDESFERVKRD